MYAVIRAGGKQYRVAPGDVIKVEKMPAENGSIEFTDILAISGEPGQITRPEGGARVVGTVLEEGRGDKILVFHFKRKKQYKKLQGHRQPFTAIRISEITFDGKKFTAPETASKPKKEKKEMASKQTEQKAEKKARTGAEGKASKSSKPRTDKGTARAAKKPAKKK